ncbi:uncharacterized protein LOC131590951 [Poecile atricapillus]|uniref:uncharacterized protein LOC131590951 n=1 Tax=Poecile atricapillus TaxID=48891 RepID=UPI002738EDE0|nr:uncharacterized protein LOC131590951 [Poecile atricapillus]XP_058717359.1 uncharacterized protein LOC131590951 [Poecile atricapillus]
MTTILPFHCHFSHQHERIINARAGNLQDRLSVILQGRSRAGSPAPLLGEFLCSLHKAGQPQRKRWRILPGGSSCLLDISLPSNRGKTRSQSHMRPPAAVGWGGGEAGRASLSPPGAEPSRSFSKVKATPSERFWRWNSRWKEPPPAKTQACRTVLTLLLSFLHSSSSGALPGCAPSTVGAEPRAAELSSWQIQKMKLCPHPSAFLQIQKMKLCPHPSAFLQIQKMKLCPHPSAFLQIQSRHCWMKLGPGCRCLGGKFPSQDCQRRKEHFSDPKNTFLTPKSQSSCLGSASGAELCPWLCPGMGLGVT